MFVLNVALELSELVSWFYKFKFWDENVNYHWNVVY